VEQVEHVVIMREQSVPSAVRICNREAIRAEARRRVPFSWEAASL
jgi:hypothetical protein